MFNKTKQICNNCGKEIQVYEKSWVLIPYPAKGMVNAQKLIELEGKLYCKSCIEVK